ncbi:MULTISPECIES: hypothetical protein [unclassified Adlercreutzia]|uniref:hypothetical protein n=1 Tax=unclassified Adlercreutzia TaxID=2636013 RepID=UPI0013E9DD5F|nr:MULTISPECIES: hypothetical protein [unclassified Adlercreutzia]
MRKLGSELSAVTGGLSSTDQAARIARRAAQVQAMFKAAIEHIYKENARYVLEHVNAVYIKKEPVGAPEAGKTVRSLLIYMDDGSFRSDVHSRQHLIMLLLKERYGEEIEVFKTFPSRFNMRNRHPYASREQDERANAPASAAPPLPLTEHERARVSRASAGIEDPRLRARFEHAMEASLCQEKGEKAAKARGV